MKKIVHSVCSKDCYGSCPIEISVENGKVTSVNPAKASEVNKGLICVKGKTYPIESLYHKDRITTPLKRIGHKGEGKFEAISWDEAFECLIKQFTTNKENYGAESIAYYRGSGTFGVMGDYGKGFWNQLGNYTTTYGTLCDGAGSTAIVHTYGEKKQNHGVHLEKASLILLWGSNPANTTIQLMHYINKSVKKGCKLVVIDPRKSESSKGCALHIKPNCGTDGLLALGLAKRLMEENLIDKPFIEKHTLGFQAYKEMVEGIKLDQVYEETGVSKEELEDLVALIRANPEFALIGGIGVQRYSNGGQTLRAISLISALTGNIGKGNAGFYHSDKQAPSLRWPYASETPKSIRQAIGLSTFGKDLAGLKNPEIKMLWIEQANPAVSNPDTNQVTKALKEIDFVVVLDQFITDTGKWADLILPTTTTPEERDLITAYGHSYVQYKEQAIEPVDSCKKECTIYRTLGEKMGMDLQYLPEDSEALLQDVLDASDINTTLEVLKNKAFLTEGYEEIAFENLVFKTPSGKIEFYSASVKEHWGANPLPVYEPVVEGKDKTPGLYKKYPLNFFSYHHKHRINSQFNQVESLKNSMGKPFLLMNEGDAKKRGIVDESPIKIYNDRGHIECFAKISQDIKEGMIALSFGWDESYKASINKLTQSVPSDMGHGTAFHNCLVEVEGV